MLKAILFDFDGVLVESVDIKTKAFAKLFEDEGTEVVGKVVEYHLANGGISRFKKFEYIYEEILRKEINDEIKNELGNRFSDLVIHNVIDAPWVSGVEDFLEQYHQIMDMYIVSGTPEDELIDIIEKRGIKKYFKGIYGSPETKGNLIKQILSSYGYSKTQVVFIGDAITDLKGAIEANIDFIGRIPDENNNPFRGYDIPVITSLKDLYKNIGL